MYYPKMSSQHSVFTAMVINKQQLHHDIVSQPSASHDRTYRSLGENSQFLLV